MTKPIFSNFEESKMITTYSNCRVWIPNEYRKPQHQILIVPDCGVLGVEVGDVLSGNPDIVNATVNITGDTRLRVSGFLVEYEWHGNDPFIKSSYSHPDKIPSSWKTEMHRIDLVFPISNWFKKFLFVYPPEPFYEVKSIKEYEDTFLNFKTIIQHKKTS